MNKHKYIIGNLLYSGGFSNIHRAFSKTNNNEYALKIIHKKLYNNNEYKLLSKLNDPSIIKLIDKFSCNEYHYLIFNLYKNGDLHDYFSKQNTKQFTKHEILHIFYKILMPIYVCHKNNIVHMDIKLENFLIEYSESTRNINNLILIDFGSSLYHNLEYNNNLSINSIIGTQDYIAPEIYNNFKYSKASDIWSLGIILYIILKNERPIVNNENILYSVNDRRAIEYDDNESDLTLLMEDILSINHRHRPTIYDLINNPIFDEVKVLS